MPKITTRAALLAALLLALLLAGRPATAEERPAKGAIRAAPTAQTPLPADKPPVPSRAPTALPLERMIGQMVMVGFVGTSPRDRGVVALLDQLRKGQIGGAIVMGRNIKSPAQLKTLTAAIHQAAREGGQPEALIAVDQEGGHVQRLKRQNGHQSFPYSARTIAERCTPEQAGQVYKALACQLHDARINVNFGPVVDLDINGDRNPIIGRYRRSFGKDPDRVVAYAGWFNAAHKSYGILTAFKHFPGHGSSLTDSHLEFTDVSATWDPVELKPYEELSQHNYTDMVMVGHLYHRRFSDGRAPASLSKKAIRDELRGRLGFDRVVITDDLQMKAVLDRYKLAPRIVLAINAGNDIVLLSNTVTPYPELGSTVFDIIRRSVRDSCPASAVASCIDRRTIEAAFARIAAMRENLGAMKVSNKPCGAYPPVNTFIKQVCRKTGLGRAGDTRRRRQSHLFQR